jgi:hypothetical protein
LGIQVGKNQQDYDDLTILADTPELVEKLPRAAEKDANSPEFPSTDSKVTPETSVNTDKELLKEIFRLTEGNTWILNNSRLKQKNKQDFFQRLSVLFLYLQEFEGVRDVTRSAFNQILEDSKVYDSYSRKWIPNNDLVSADENFVRLSSPGRDSARQVLTEFRDPNIPTLWTVGTRTHTRAKDSAKTAKDSKKQAAGKTRPKQKGIYETQIKNLMTTGFFKTEVTIKQVEKELERRGHNFDSRRIGEVLLRLTKSGDLVRHENESKGWAYQDGKKK